MPIEKLFSRPSGVASKNPYALPLPGPTLGGECWWCRKPIFRRDGTPAVKVRIHTECVREVFNVFDPDLGARAVADKSNWRCAACGAPLREYCEGGGPWEVDHIIPLADALPHADSPWWPWRLPNLQALCRFCYLEKLERDSACWRRRRERALWEKSHA